jgi:hypothetical protein
MEQTGCSRVVCPGVRRIGIRVGIRIGIRFGEGKRARSRRPGPAACEWRSLRGAVCHQPDPSLPTTGVRGRAAVTLKSSSKGRWRGREVLEPRGSKWSKWVQGERGKEKKKTTRNREVIAEPKTERVEGERCRGGTTHARRREAVDAARGPPEDGQGRVGGSRRRVVPRRDHACAPTRSRRRSARSA